MTGDADGVLVFFDVGAERAHACERAVAVRRGSEVAKFAGAFGDGGQHGIAMRDGFIARRLDAAGDVFCGLDNLLFHATILAWRLRIPGAAKHVWAIEQKLPSAAKAGLLSRSSRHG